MVSSKIQGTKAIVPLPIKVEICLTSEQIIQRERILNRKTRLFIGAMNQICFVNYIADTLCYDAIPMLKADNSVPTAIKKQGKHLDTMLREYDGVVAKRMGKENNARCAFISTYLMDEIQDRIDDIENELLKVMENIEHRALFAKVILACMFEQFALYNCEDRIKEYRSEFGADSAFAPLVHLQIFKKVDLIARLLAIPDLSKELTISSKFIRIQKLFFDTDWIAQVMDRAIEENKNQIELLKD